MGIPTSRKAPLLCVEPATTAAPTTATERDEIRRHTNDERRPQKDRHQRRHRPSSVGTCNGPEANTPDIGVLRTVALPTETGKLIIREVMKRPHEVLRIMEGCSMPPTIHDDALCGAEDKAMSHQTALNNHHDVRGCSHVRRSRRRAVVQSFPSKSRSRRLYELCVLPDFPCPKDWPGIEIDTGHDASAIDWIHIDGKSSAISPSHFEYHHGAGSFDHHVLGKLAPI